MKLLALRCPECARSLAPVPDGVVVACENCAVAVHIDERGLATLAARYAAPRQEGATHWLPFWIFYGRVHLAQRDTQGGSRRAGKTAERFWQAPHHLYVPAWDLPLPEARALGSDLVQKQPLYQAIPRPAEVHFTPATVTAEDALKLLEFIVLTIEARRKDWLKNLRFRLEVDEPEFWLIPAQKKRGTWQLLAMEDKS